MFRCGEAGNSRDIECVCGRRARGGRVVCWGEEIRESGGLAVGLEWVGMGQDVDL